jgi:hypothetical protein
VFLTGGGASILPKGGSHTEQVPSRPIARHFAPLLPARPGVDFAGGLLEPEEVCWCRRAYRVRWGNGVRAQHSISSPAVARAR